MGYNNPDTGENLEARLVEAEKKLEAVRAASEGRDLILESRLKTIEHLNLNLAAREKQCARQHTELVELRRSINRYERILFIAAELRELVHSPSALDESIKTIKEEA